MIRKEECGTPQGGVCVCVCSFFFLVFKMCLERVHWSSCLLHPTSRPLREKFMFSAFFFLLKVHTTLILCISCNFCWKLVILGNVANMDSDSFPSWFCLFVLIIWIEWAKFTSFAYEVVDVTSQRAQLWACMQSPWDGNGFSPLFLISIFSCLLHLVSHAVVRFH